MSDQQPPQPGAPAAAGATADPSMEDILASIRRILSDDEAEQGATPAATPPDDGVLALDASMLVEEPARALDPLARSALPPARAALPPARAALPPAEQQPERAISDFIEAPAPLARADALFWRGNLAEIHSSHLDHLHRCEKCALALDQMLNKQESDGST